MRCLKCGFGQKDGRTECKKCGVIFANYTAPAAPLQYEEVDDWRTQLAEHWMKIVAVGLLLLMPIGVYRLFRSDSGAPSELDEPNLRFSRLRQHDAINEACMQSLIDMGSTELEARANCYDDPEAKNQLDKAESDHVKSLNIVPADQIERAELRVKMDTLMPTDYYARGDLFLLLYDAKGNPASAAGKVKLSCSEPEVCTIDFADLKTNPRNFKYIHQQDGKKFLVYVLPQIRVNRERCKEGDVLVVTAEFDGDVAADLRVQVEPLPKQRGSEGYGEDSAEISGEEE